MQKRLSWSGAYPAALTQVAETVETLDSMNRIWVMTNRRSDAMGAPVFSSHTYSFDTANRRDLAVREPERPVAEETDRAPHGPQGDGPVRRGRSQHGTRWDYDYNDRSEPESAGADAGRLPTGSPQGADTVGRWRRQLTAAKRQLGNGTLLAGTESTYEYDAIGNRTLSISGGGPAVASNGTDDVKRSVSYESNALNQYTKMTQGARSFDVAGRYVYDPAASGSSPQVNGIAPWEQTISSGAGGTQLKHFRTSLTAAASGNATGNYENVNVSTAAGTVLEYSGLKWVPKTIVQPTYDFDGNLLTDGRWTYTWDAEPRRLAGAETERALARPRRGEGAVRWRLNQYRLKSMSHNGSVTPYVPGLLVEFRYDGLSRRVEKKVSTFNGSIWIEQLRERTLYCGWSRSAWRERRQPAAGSPQGGRPVRRDGRQHSPIGAWRLQPPDAGHSNPWWKLPQHYVWGPDISGTEQGAGGVGGLAMIIGGSSGNWFPCYDGNGNITALVDALPNGALAAQYDYDAFGNPVRMSGPAAKFNPFRFSTKFTDDETELVYYGYRYYSPGMGRWLSRDPMGESGGEALYVMTENNCLMHYDFLGLEKLTWTIDLPHEHEVEQHKKLLNDEGSVFQSVDEATKKIVSMIGRYHPEGEGKCNCFKRLIIASHGSHGVIGFPAKSGAAFQADINDQIRTLSIFNDPRRAIKDKAADEAERQRFKDLVAMKDLITAATIFLCRDGKVIFAVCNAGAGEEGKKLQEYLDKLAGGPGKVILEQGYCKLGSPWWRSPLVVPANSVGERDWSLKKH